MNRRGFLQSILALAAAPAIVKAENLMILPPQNVLIPGEFGHYDGFSFIEWSNFDMTFAERLVAVREMVIAQCGFKAVLGNVLPTVNRTTADPLGIAGMISAYRNIRLGAEAGSPGAEKSLLNLDPVLEIARRRNDVGVERAIGRGKAVSRRGR